MLGFPKLATTNINKKPIHLMKKHLTSALFAAVCVTMLSTASAQMVYTPGDLLMGFQASGGTGGTSTYVFNLGAATHYRDNPQVGFGNIDNFVFNIGADLTAVFGADWFERTDLKFGIGGVRTNLPDVAVNGDPGRTVYVSYGTLVPGNGASYNLNNSAVNTASTNIVGMVSGYETTNGTTPRTPTLTSGGRGTIQGTGDINSWNDYVSFNGSSFAVFTAALQSPFGNGQGFAYLDLQRILGNNQPAGTVNPNPTGQGAYVNTFRIDSLGNITVIPEPSTVLLLSLAGLLVLARRKFSRLSA